MGYSIIIPFSSCCAPHLRDIIEALAQLVRSQQEEHLPMAVYDGRIVIVGVAESDYGRVPNMTELQLHAQAIQRALADSGLRKKDIDGVFCSSDTMSMPTV